MSTTKSTLSKEAVDALKEAGKDLVVPVARVYMTKRYPVAVLQLGVKLVRLLLTKKTLKTLKLETADSLEGKLLRVNDAGIPVRVLARMPRAKKAK